MASDYRNFLHPGERVVWQGQPPTGLMLRPIEIFLIPFSLFWGGFAIFWNFTAWTSAGDASFSLFGVPFLVIGLYIIVGRFAVDSIIRRRMLYFVTNQRILIVRGNGASSKSLDIKRLPMVELKEKPDGSGTLRFGDGQSIFAGNGFHIWNPAFDPTPQFLGIDNVRSVYAMINKQADAA